MKNKSVYLALKLPASILQAQDADLAKKLANPISNLISVPVQSNFCLQNDQWTVPLNFQVSQLFKIGDQPVQAFVGARYYAEEPDNGPEWGPRAGLTFLFPN